MAVVIVWNNNLVGGASYVGHSSMLISDRWNRAKGYVSWWPEDKAGPFGKESAALNKNFLQDLETEGYAPDHVIHIADLATAAMQAEWDMIRSKQNSHYQLVRKNCSSIVARVLKKGATIGSYAKRHHAVWTPLKVKRLALAMLGEEKGFAWLLQEARLDNLISANELTMLSNLRKRDDRHGTAGGTASYYANGRSIAPKLTFHSSGYGRREGFTINMAAGRQAMFADGGSLMGGSFQPTPEGLDFQPDEA